ncbi:hypothetical protein N7475_003569 [Penicillium sp. IBT 31633x]|nr:hypothetical protein N7475_003569 [Penicillium sp. IBT 31633x]
MNGFPPPSGLSFPSNGVGFAPSYVGVGSYSGPPNSAVPIPDAMPSNDALPQSDTYPWMPPRGVPAQLVSPSEKQILPHEKSNPPINPISPASSDSLDERSVESSSWGDHAQEFATLFEDDDPEDDNPQDLMATSAEPGAPDLAVSSKNTDIPFDVTDKLSMEATKLSTIAGGLSSTMSRLSEVMNELPATADKLANTVSDLSQTVPLISSKVEGISSFHEGLNARTQQLSDTVDKLSQTLSEMVKRERIVMEAFGTMKEIRERPQVPFEFQNKATRKRK